MGFSNQRLPFRRVTKAGDYPVFHRRPGSKRRKMLSSALSDRINKAQLLQACAQSQIDPTRRGETLSIQEFAALTNALSQL